MERREPNRREVLRMGTAACAGVLLSAGCAERAEPIAATEDLMREHGVLERVLLIYDESARRLEADDVAGIEVVHRSAQLVRRFVEDYHVKMEDEHVFPHAKEDERYAPLVAVLTRQHQVSRILTDTLLRDAKLDGVREPEGRTRIARTLRDFATMHRAHGAREETVLFPALRELLSPGQLDDLSERLERTEHERFGRRGFSEIVAQVAGFEQELGLSDLSRYTPT